MKSLRTRLTVLVRFVEGKETLLAIVAASIVLVAGAAYALHLGEDLPNFDERDYTSIAWNIVSKGMFSMDGVQPSSFRPPAYPWLLAPFMWLGASIPMLRILNFLLLGGTMMFLYLFVQRIAGKLAGAVSAILVLLYPVLFYAAGTLYAQTLAGFLLMLALWLLAENETDGIRSYVLAGLAFGLLILTVPSFVFALFVTVAWLLFSNRKRLLRNASVVVVAAALVLAPWSLRNYGVFERFVFVSSNSGLNLLFGNSQFTSPNSGTDVDIRQYWTDPAADEITVDRHFRNEAVKYIMENKLHSVKMYCLKVLNYFNYQVGAVTAANRATGQDVVMLLTYGPLLLLVIGRFFSIKRFPMSRFEVLLGLVYFSNALFAAIFFTRVRFRLPYDWLLIALAGIFLSRLVQGYLSGRGGAETGPPAESRLA